MTTTIGTPAKFGSRRAGSAWTRQADWPGPGAGRSSRASSEGSAAGGSKLSGMAVSPQSSPPPGRSMNGGPIGSTATTAFTSPGRASVTTQPNGPPAEWVSRIDGPIRSSSAAPQRCMCPWVAAKSPIEGPIPASIWSSAVPPAGGTACGHWSCSDACG